MTAHITITDMTCQNCVRHVRQALEKVPGVESAEVDLDSKSASVSGSFMDTAELIDAIRKAGYAASALA